MANTNEMHRGRFDKCAKSTQATLAEPTYDTHRDHSGMCEAKTLRPFGWVPILRPHMWRVQTASQRYAHDTFQIKTVEAQSVTNG